ncbi:MAG: hypothetical protein SNJ59_12460 [Aggregatilineales bacterium]
MTIWDFQTLVSQRLLEWARLSTAIGAVMLAGNTFWQRAGFQFLGWAAVNALLAVFGQRAAQKRAGQMPKLLAQPIRRKTARGFRRLLWINAGLDILYIIGALWWMRRRPEDAAAQGTGAGIIAQSAFLFVFDVAHALRVPDVDA